MMLPVNDTWSRAGLGSTTGASTEHPVLQYMFVHQPINTYTARHKRSDRFKMPTNNVKTLRRSRVLISFVLIAVQYIADLGVYAAVLQPSTGNQARHTRQSRLPAGIAGGLFGNRWNVSPSPRCTCLV